MYKCIELYYFFFIFFYLYLKNYFYFQVWLVVQSLDGRCTGRCLKPKQFLKAEHLLKHAFLYRDQFFYGPGR